MAMTDPDLYEIARELIRRIYVEPLQTAEHDRDEIKNAVALIDTAMNATGDQIVTAGYGAVPLKNAMYQELQKVMPTATPQQGAIALALWALKEAGLL